MAKQIIRTGLGEVEDVTAVVPSDAQAPKVALGSSKAPTAWLDPTRVENDDEAGTKLLVLTVGPSPHLNPVAGRYWLWWRYLDGTGQELVLHASNSVTVETTAGDVLTPQAPFATVGYVDTADAATLVAAKAYTDTHGGGGSAGVSSFQTRTGAVSLTKADVTGTGLTAADIGASTFSGAYSALTGKPTIPSTKADVGLGNVDNTADTAKPVSAAQATAISTAINNLVNSAPGTLDTLGEIAAQLASDESAVGALTTAVNGKYTKPGGGIPAADLAAAVQTLLNRKYDPGTQRYNFTAANTQAARAAESRALAGAAGCHVLALGTSLTAGAGASRATSWPAVLRNQLAALGYPVGGTGWVPAAPLPADSRISMAGGAAAFTAGNSALISSGGTTGSTATFAADAPGTVVEFVYLDFPGPLTYAIDGAAPVTVTPGNSGGLRKVTVTGLPNANHSIVVTWTTSNIGFVAAFCCRPATGLIVSNFGYSGATTPAPGDPAYSLFNVALFVAPDVAYVEYGTNDPANNQTNLSYVVTALRATAGVYLLTAPPRATAGSSGVGSDQNVNVYAVADILNVPLIDWGDRFGAPIGASLGASGQAAVYNALPASWLPGDGTHFTAQAYQDVATMVRVAASQAVTNAKLDTATAASTYLPLWKPQTTYVAGQRVTNPDGRIATAKADFTSGDTYNAANWNLLTHGAAHAPATGGVGGTDLIPWNLVNQSGPIASRPPAAEVGPGIFYNANDQFGSTLYRSNGTTWTKCAPGANELTLPFKVVYGSTDVEIQAAIDSLGAQGGTVFLPPGNYTINNTLTIGNNQVTLEGAGPYATKLIAASDITILSVSGPTSGGVGNPGNHRHRITLKNITFDGGSAFGTQNLTWGTQPMVKFSYIDTCRFEHVYFINKPGIGFLGLDFWASTFWQCRWDLCGGFTGVTGHGGKPAMLLCSNDGTAASAVGANTNDITFIRCQWETSGDGGAWLLGEDPPGAVVANTPRNVANFNFIACAFDDGLTIAGPQLMISQAYGVRLQDCTHSAFMANQGGGQVGPTTPPASFLIRASFEVAIRDQSFLFSGTAPMARSGITFDSSYVGDNGVTGNTFCTVDNILGSSNGPGAPSVGLVEYVGSANTQFDVGTVAWRRNGSSSSPRIVGSPGLSSLRLRQHRVKTGAPTDADFNSQIPGPAVDGMGPVIDQNTGNAYYRVGGVWKTGAGVAPLLGTDTVANRPAAAASNASYFYFATDLNGGTLQRSNGSVWNDVAPGLNVANAATPSLIGGHKRTSAVENGPRWAFLQTAQGTTNGRMILSFVTPDADTAVTKIAYSSAATAAAGATLIRFGLFTVDGSGNLTLVARTASDTTIFNATASEFSRALDATGGFPTSYTMVAGQRYAFGVLIVGATTLPSLAGPNSMLSASGNSAPRVFARLDSQTDLPATVTAGSLVNNLAGVYAAALS